MHVPSGFLGTRGDLVFDLVITSLVAVVPLLFRSRALAREGRWLEHKRVQVGLAALLLLVLVIFETNLQLQGGIFELARPSRYSGTRVLSLAVYGHLLFSFSSAALWVLLIAASLVKFEKVPKPNAFSRFHRIAGTLAMWDLILTGFTGVALYIVVFAL